MILSFFTELMDGWMDGFVKFQSPINWMDGWMDGLGNSHSPISWMDGLPFFIHSFIHSSSSVSQKKRQPASPETLASPVRSLACSLAGWLAGPLARSLACLLPMHSALSLLSHCCLHSQSKPICASLKIVSHFLHLLSAVGFLCCSSTLSCATHVCVVRLVCFVCVCGDWGAVFFVSGFGFAAGICIYMICCFFLAIVVVVVVVVVIIVLVVVGT
jgi:hypothetical protein